MNIQYNEHTAYDTQTSFQKVVKKNTGPKQNTYKKSLREMRDGNKRREWEESL